MADDGLIEEVCPTPEYHGTHYYCPSCTWVAEDAPVSEAEAQRGRANLLHAQLGAALAKLDAAERVVEAARAWDRAMRDLVASDGMMGDALADNMAGLHHALAAYDVRLADG